MAENQPPQGQQRAGEHYKFTVEFGNDRLANQVLIASPPIQRMVRGAFSIGRLGRRKHLAPDGPMVGKHLGSRDVGGAATRVPDIPGMRLTVDTRRGKLRLFDPLEHDQAGKEALANYNQMVKSPDRVGFFQEAAPMAESEHEANEDQIKTLMIELRRKLDNGDCSVVEGTFPEMKAIQAMAGRQLYDPSNSSRKPKYADESEAWMERLERVNV